MPQHIYARAGVDVKYYGACTRKANLWVFELS